MGGQGVLRTWSGNTLLQTTIALAVAGLMFPNGVSVSVAGSQGHSNEAHDRNDARRDPCERGRSHPHDQGHHRGHARECPPFPGSSGVSGGDFNDDGIADLAIGAPDEDVVVQTGVLPPTSTTVNDAGVVHIIYGTAADGLSASGTGIPTNQRLRQADPVVVPGDKAEAQDRFGATLAAGDFNGDGVSDLAVGVGGETVSGQPGVGAVQVFNGKADAGLSAAPSAFFGPATFTADANPSSLIATRSLTWGRFNDDQFGDLVVASEYFGGSPFARRAVVTFLFGSASGLTTAKKVQFYTDVVPAEISQFPLPLILAAGDFNGDQLSDLAVGSPNRSNLQGGVHVVYGTPSGPTLDGQQLWDRSAANMPGTPSSFETWGAALAIGDFNGDAFDDLAIGIPGRLASGENDAGAVIVIHGSLARLNAPASGSLASKVFTQASATAWGTPELHDHFGAALAAGDFNGDGAEDLAIGVPDEDLALSDDAGEVDIVYGLAVTGLSTTAGGRPAQRWHQNSISGVEDTGERLGTNDHFGAALSAWNFGHSTHKDLAIGVPLEDVGTIEDAGIVQVLYGSVNGLTGVANQVWSQDSQGIADTAESGDHFGQSVY